MPLTVRSMQVGPIEDRNATVELVISDNEEEDKAVEILRIRMLVDVRNDSYLPAVQVAVMRIYPLTASSHYGILES